MRIEERGSRIEDRSAGFNPQSTILDPVFKRMRWRCRRGLLELDIVLGRFVGAHYARLDKAGQQAFDALLDMPDTLLWDMIIGRQDAVPGNLQTLLEKIRGV